MIFIPYNYNIIFFKTTKIILISVYNIKNKIKMPVLITSDIYFDKNTNCVLFDKNCLKSNWNLIVNKLNKNIFIFDNVFFNKIK